MIVSFNPNITKKNNPPKMANNNPVAFKQGLPQYILKDVTAPYVSLASVCNGLMYHIGLTGKDFNPTEAASDFKKALKGHENNPRVIETKKFLAEEYNLVF